MPGKIPRTSLSEAHVPRPAQAALPTRFPNLRNLHFHGERLLRGSGTINSHLRVTLNLMKQRKSHQSTSAVQMRLLIRLAAKRVRREDAQPPLARPQRDPLHVLAARPLCANPPRSLTRGRPLCPSAYGAGRTQAAAQGVVSCSREVCSRPCACLPSPRPVPIAIPFFILDS